jgi:glycosyltransferase involved in cell wall biosynthesis
MPKISICIPTYNSARYLGAAIESALAQDAGDFEVVVCDNASTDETPELIRKYATDSRLRPVRYEQLVGQAANWNRCLDLARGEYIVLLHADDVLRPAFIRRAAEIIDANPDVGLVHCAVQHVDTNLAPLHLQSLFDEDRVDREGDLLRRLLLDGCVVNPCGVMVRRSVYERIGRFTEEIVWGVDWHMWIRVALCGPAAYLSETLALYRQHAQSGTSGVMATARNGLDELWMMKDIFARIPAERADLHALQPQVIRGIAHRTWCFAEEMCRLGYRRAARAGIRRAVGIRPAMLADPKVWGLWLATWLGYGWFTALHTWKQRWM